MDTEEQTLLSCPAGVPVKVLRVAGGAGFHLRLKNLGLVEGKTLTKVHSHPFGGPVTVRLQHTQLAIGHGMAKRIYVEISS
ncbi:MAG: ferrous iron transport protein A [Candidatus Pacebacteria bacterium]|nr:ferrous iron transport protein A [Candidatus Paceibacterota bacterium]